MADRMNRLGVDCAVVYVDADLKTPGDGGTPATALKALPQALVKETIYLCRRTLAANVVVQTPGGECYCVSMPEKANMLFNDVPKTAQEAWGADLLPVHAFTVIGNDVSHAPILK